MHSSSITLLISKAIILKVQSIVNHPGAEVKSAKKAVFFPILFFFSILHFIHVKKIIKECVLHKNLNIFSLCYIIRLVL